MKQLPNLPTELQLQIFDYLDCVDQTALLVSCRHLYTNENLSRRLRELRFDLPTQDKRDIMFRLCQDAPGFLDYWPCTVCHQFHHIKSQDTPGTLKAAVDGAHESLTENCSYWFNKALYTPFGSYQLSDRHILQALKYHAIKQQDPEMLTGPRAEILDKLLAPHHSVCWLGDLYTNDHSSTTPEHSVYSVFPKIVDGRFLLFSTWAYPVQDSQVFPGTGIDMFICKHLGVSKDDGSLYALYCGDEHDHSPENSAKENACCRHWPDLLYDTSLRLFDCSDVEHRGSCLYCHTDYSVTYFKDHAPGRCIVYCSWQDLGSIKTSISDPSRLAIDFNQRAGDASWHQAGSIREAYGSSFQIPELLSYLEKETPSWESRSQGIFPQWLYPHIGTEQTFLKWTHHRSWLPGNGVAAFGDYPLVRLRDRIYRYPLS